MHEQLIHESPEENFSEKRVNLLKSQILQLERQVRGLVQTICGKISVIMTFRGEGAESLTLSLAFRLQKH